MAICFHKSEPQTAFLIYIPERSDFNIPGIVGLWEPQGSGSICQTIVHIMVPAAEDKNTGITEIIQGMFVYDTITSALSKCVSEEIQ